MRISGPLTQIQGMDLETTAARHIVRLTLTLDWSYNKGSQHFVPSKPGMLEVATRVTVCLGCHNGFHVFCGLLSRVLRIDSCNCNAHSCILERKDVQGVIQCNVV